ncbi:GNAT family N-acetyltransferase [Macrococcus armenti]|uniref:GNAT family N-acetyltransferase n=1 Tax=Macrococcus armenti TaxID=2875764 RepID=UPI001CCFE606|nr:GNAT family N-acetyltransferase [Macrococcus armenti]UBH09663.1 GNAT family N-acetyltransferase [Macrococcus armenti]UBH11937.1 GNAT family N-acetyltransferase [Macrococcus armenti]
MTLYRKFLQKGDSMLKQIYEINDKILELLLLADPSIEMINQYLSESSIYTVEEKDLIGVIVLKKISESTMEIMNIAVSDAYQGKGYGKLMLKEAEKIAKHSGYNNLIIATANSSLNQLALYQKCGFRLHKIEKDFFINNYKEVIMENSIRAMDKIILRKLV